MKTKKTNAYMQMVPSWMLKAVIYSTVGSFAVAVIFGPWALFLIPFIFLIYDLFASYILSGRKADDFLKHTFLYYFINICILIALFFLRGGHVEFQGEVDIAYYALLYVTSPVLYLPLKALISGTKKSLKEVALFAISSAWMNALVIFALVTISIFIMVVIVTRHTLIG